MTPQANSTASRDIASHLHPYTNLEALAQNGPLVIERGEGIRVFDDEGNPYIEAMSGLWCTSLGWGEERLVEAAARQMRRLGFYHCFTAKVPDVTVDLAERLLALAPVPMSKVFFANSGSEAIDTALKLVWYLNNKRARPEKKKVIARHKAYHGVTIGSASLTGLPLNHRDFDLPIKGVLHTDCPHYYRFAEADESEEDFATRLARNLEKLILDEGPETVAAFFAEPVMGAGGVIVPPATYFQKIQAILKKYDVLLIADEVICGFGRTANMWGSETFSLKPDMMTMAKALSSGYLPISALMVSEEIYTDVREHSATLGTFAHGFTYSGHPVSCAVALETLKIYEERNILGHVRRVSPAFQDMLRRYRDHPLVGEARGVGLVGALELVRDKSTRESFAPADGVGARLVTQAQKNGLIVRALGDSIALSPPLIITEDEISDIARRLGAALDATARWADETGIRPG
ncbi:aspartate aminotransferase family protein [Varunaivibrio sulfuroxidans]|uniref:4-aminobutyrate--pyruvate transaminase n=1 Tax=Varunaivibrio sulfuroxidans TaxID=1773489 RepID=A0A4V2UN62_9PROT|nr:aspartate aminotransferase family protein [Varunaivibrio sulfuroxidans]TCS60851.1 4-aminobutyrate--pyruvate transaminase [Varunaivibrio sulfuroxidans]WES31735.1 aspartate aminotransferase family protein [Varunaivibrio sulfuroxidans]